MKSKLLAALALALLGALTLRSSTCLAQGSLTPPGAPAPTMKTLDQVEPRIPLGGSTTPGDATCLFRVTNSGSYYLAGNASGQAGKSGIVVAADNVTIDLRGYTLDGGGTNSLQGIRPSGIHTGLVVRNGRISGWGGPAIASYVMGMPDDSFFSECVYADLLASRNGGGIGAGYGSSIFRCVSRNNQGTGIQLSNNSGVCRDSVSEANTGDGISCAEGATVVNCSVQANTGVGINCINSQHTILGCTVRNNAGGGIYGWGTQVRDCTIDGNTGYGVKVVFDCTVERNSIRNTQSGFGVAGGNIGGTGNNRIVDNHFSRNPVGIMLTNNPGNFIYRNTLQNTVNLDVGSVNTAPVATDAATAGPWHNITK